MASMANAPTTKDFRAEYLQRMSGPRPALFKSRKAMQVQRINTIAELQAEQDRLKQKMSVTHQAFHTSAAHTAAGTREFLVKNVLLPAGAVGLGIWVAKKVAAHSHRQPEHAEMASAPISVEKEKPAEGWFSKLMLVALPFIQQAFLNLKASEEAAEDSGHGHAGQAKNSLASWLTALVPIAVPLAQQYFVKKEEEAKEQIITFDRDGNEVPRATSATATPKEGSAAVFDTLYKMLPVVLPLVQQYFASSRKEAPAERHRSPNGRYADAVA